mgnify:CR=1 FL=1
MNKSLRQLFTIVVALFVILGMSTTIIMAIRANQLTNDARNVRALYHEYGAPRGSILAADGSVIAKSDPSNDSFSYQRSYSAGELYAPVTGFFSISQRGWSGVEASRSSLLSGQSEQLLWQRFKSLFTGQENKGANIENVHRSEDSAGRIQQPRQHGWRRSGHRAENRPYPRHGQYAQLRPEPAGQP